MFLIHRGVPLLTAFLSGQKDPSSCFHIRLKYREDPTNVGFLKNMVECPVSPKQAGYISDLETKNKREIQILAQNLSSDLMPFSFLSNKLFFL